MFLFRSEDRVIRALITYTDWWQPATTSLLLVGRARRGASEGIRPGLLETLDEREELRRRVLTLDEADRHLLLLWYVTQLSADEIAEATGLSRRQCFRRRNKAIRTILDLDPDEDGLES